jgi:hypothetical protein
MKRLSLAESVKRAAAPTAPTKQDAAPADASETVKVTFELKKTIYKRLSRLALDMDTSNRAVITEAIQEYLAKSR